jgi:geranylgeranyl diphosphate synthase type II
MMPKQMEKERILALKARIDEEIPKRLDGREPASLYEPMAYILKAGGKRVRPILVILSCQSVGGGFEECLEAALAVEFLHSFTLIHDDIMDHDDLRRGVPTVHKKWDEATAILAGDGLVSLAFSTLVRQSSAKLPRIVQIFTDGLLAVCEGQALDKAFEVQDSVSLKAYREMIVLKTARLMEVACGMGAVLGGADPDQEDSLRRFALNLGEAFQIQDDLLDVVAEEDVFGKPRGSDLTERKKTFLTLDFFQKASSAEKGRFLEVWGKESVERDAVEELIALLHRTGSVKRARQEAKSLLSRALACLESLPVSGARDTLAYLVHYLEERLA